MTDLRNSLGEVLEINPMNNKKYIEAVSFRDWQTCDLICDEHTVLVGRIKNLEQELQKTREQLEKALIHLKIVLVDDTTSDQFCDAEEFLSSFKDKQGE